ncbi:MAG: hypothetical protein QG597_4649 [Actinomycetota bacterium]|nr:hypothetical protein [Actinomycetota bacterium]
MNRSRLLRGATSPRPRAGDREAIPWLQLSSGRIGQILGVMLAQSAVFAALLSYFGGVRTHALYDYFGVDAKALGLSTGDNLQQAFNLAVPLLLYGGLAILVVIQGATMIAIPIGRRPRLATALAVVMATIGGMVVVLGLVAMRGWNIFGLPTVVLPLGIGAGLSLIIGAVRLAARVSPTVPALSSSMLATMLGVVAGSIVWSWSQYAWDVGQDGGRTISETLVQRQAVALYSTKHLALWGHGIQLVDLTQTGSVYPVRYDGLRLLTVAANGDLYLLPKNWIKGVDPVIVIRPTETTRVEIVASHEN